MESTAFLGGGYRYLLVMLSAIAALLLVIGPGRLLDGWAIAVLIGCLVAFVVGSFRTTGVEVRRLDQDSVSVRLRVGPIVMWRRVSSLEMLLIEVDARAVSSWFMRSRWPGLYALVITGVDEHRTWRKPLVPEYPDYLRSIDSAACLSRARALVSELTSRAG